MKATTLNTIRQLIIKNEKQPPHPYLDIKGNVTIGTGFHIQEEKDFVALPLINRETGKPASQAEKKEEFANMRGLRDKQSKEPEKFNRLASTYKDDTKLYMPLEEQNKRLDEEIATRSEDIKKDVGVDAWDKLSDGQKAAVVDVHYANGSLKDFPALKKAIQSGDAEAMARESTFYTDRDAGKRDLGRLARNRAAVTGEDIAVARGNLEDSLKGQAKNLDPAPQTDPANDDVKGASGNDSLSDRDSAQPAYAPEIQNFLEDLKKSDDPVSDILLKDSSDWTQEEVNQVHASDAYQIASNPKRAEATGKVKAWYDQHYTTNPVQKDETGKTVDPVLTTVPRKEPVAARGKDGQPVLDGVLGAGAKIADMAGKNGLSTAIKGAQIGFNLLRKLLSGNENAGLLKTDGLFGPRTKQALRGSVAELGRPKVENAVALGTFQNLLEKKRGDLAQATHDSFSGLFQKPALFKAADKNPTPWGLVVQDTLNDISGDAFKPLKSDGWIGPKTADAFRRTLKLSGMGGFLEKLGSNFGFF